MLTTLCLSVFGVLEVFVNVNSFFLSRLFERQVLIKRFPPLCHFSLTVNAFAVCN